MWVRNAWYVAGWLPEFAPGAIHARTIIDQPIALYRTADGGLAALEDRCCHRLAPLSMGRLEGGVVSRPARRDPALPGARRSRLPAESRPSRLRGALPPDRRQPPRSFAPLLRAREDPGTRHA